jgi:hypothetical protein
VSRRGYDLLVERRDALLQTIAAGQIGTAASSQLTELVAIEQALALMSIADVLENYDARERVAREQERRRSMGQW